MLASPGSQTTLSIITCIYKITAYFTHKMKSGTEALTLRRQITTFGWSASFDCGLTDWSFFELLGWRQWRKLLHQIAKSVIFLQKRDIEELTVCICITSLHFMMASGDSKSSSNYASQQNNLTIITTLLHLDPSSTLTNWQRWMRDCLVFTSRQVHYFNINLIFLVWIVDSMTRVL